SAFFSLFCFSVSSPSATSTLSLHDALPIFLAPLADALGLVGVPGARLLDDPLLDAGVEDRAGLRDALAVKNVELRLAERSRQLVLHHLDLRAHADGFRALLDRVLPADVEPHRGIELQRAAAGGRFRRVVDDDAVGQIGVLAFDLEIEAMHRTRRRFDVTPRDLRGNSP